MKNPIKNPFVFNRKTAFMQRIADLVRTGHTRYLMGEISIEKAGFFASKMNFHYGCLENNKTQFNQREKGFAGSRLLFLYIKDSPVLIWILLVTNGNWLTPDSGHERWLDVKEERIILTGYQLIRQVKKKKLVEKEVEKESPENEVEEKKRIYSQRFRSEFTWTWAYTKEQNEKLRDQIVMSIRRHRTDELRQLIDTIYRSPAFAGVREQIKKFAKLIKAEWTRTGVGDMPELPKGLGYVRRLPDKGKLLTDLLKEIKNGNREED